jgi:hypothetical protein
MISYGTGFSGEASSWKKLWDMFVFPAFTCGLLVGPTTNERVCFPRPLINKSGPVNFRLEKRCARPNQNGLGNYQAWTHTRACAHLEQDVALLTERFPVNSYL